MILFDHPAWAYLLPFVHVDEGRDNLDLLQLPDQLREIALNIFANCVSCGVPIKPLRARVKSERARVAGSPTERRLFYAPTCPTDVNPGCSRTAAAKQHKNLVRDKFAVKKEQVKAQLAALPPIDNFFGEWRFLSNFWTLSEPILFEEIFYSSTEAAYQAAKTLDHARRLAIAAMSPGEAKKAGRAVVLRADWEEVKLRVMEQLLRSKFAQPGLAAKLAATRGRKLVEGNTWGDTYWGVCGGVGENRLGKLLMKIRDESLSIESSPAVEKMIGSAWIEGLYRYSLTRDWTNGRGKRLLSIMHNPSEADAENPDPTLLRNIHFARAWGFGSLEVVNPFAGRSPKPKVLAAMLDPVGPKCDSAIDQALATASAYLVAWGRPSEKKLEPRVAEVERLVLDRAKHFGVPAYCLGYTKEGYPKHPLARGAHRVPDDQQPILYAPRPIFARVGCYSALCFKEPWLELILLGFKTLETRTKCLRKSGGEVVLTSSTIDEAAWNDPAVGGLLDSAAKERAVAGLGKVRGIAQMSGFRPGIPGADDAAALISILLPDGAARFVADVSSVRRLCEVPTVRVRPDGSEIAGSMQGFFEVPSRLVESA